MNILLSLSAGVALSMDCLAVASCYGMQLPHNKRLMFELGVWFGLFQMTMILVGSLMGDLIVNIVYQYAKVLSAGLLIAVAIKMFIEGIKGEDVCYETKRIRIISLALATSIDSLLLGLAYSILRENILATSIIVGIVCFVITIIGFIIGSFLHRFVERAAQFTGAGILILIALKALIS